MKKQINLDLLENLFDLDWPITITKTFSKGQTFFPVQRGLILNIADELMDFYGIVAMLAKADEFEISQVKPREVGVNAHHIFTEDLLYRVLDYNECTEEICVNCFYTIVKSEPPDAMNEMEFQTFQTTMSEWAIEGYIPIGQLPYRRHEFFKNESCPLCDAVPGNRVEYIFEQKIQTS